MARIDMTCVKQMHHPQVNLAVASAQAACNSMNGVAAKGAVVLVPRGAAGACTWTDIARAVQRKGGLALMAADDGLSIAYTPPDPVLASGQQVPCSIIRQRFGQWIYGNATRSARMTIARVQVRQLPAPMEAWSRLRITV